MATFQGEDVALEEDILKKPREFVKTWAEWAANTQEIVVVDTFTSSAAASTMFVVPARHVLFITSAWLNITTTGATALKNTSIHATTGSGQTGAQPPLLRISIDDAATNDSTSTTFPMPLMVREGGTVELLGAGNARCNAGISGFVVSKEVS